MLADPRAAGRLPRHSLPPQRPGLTLLACVAVAAASLALHRTPDFDPTAWLIWGRELGHGTLSTLGGPSWKPLPVLFTTPFAFAGDTVAPWLWLVVARTGGLLALVAAFRLTWRLGGRTPALLATAALALATEFLYNAARGDSEGLLVALTLWAVDLHLAGRRLAAVGAGMAAALLRPEVWPLLLVYGAWLLWTERNPRTVIVLTGGTVAVLALWFVPEHAGSGDWLRAATRAQNPVPGSPGQSALPFIVTFVDSAVALAVPVYAGAVRAVVTAVRSGAASVRDRAVLVLAAGSTLFMVIVAALAQNGFSGNLRYVTLPAAVLCVLGGLGLPDLVGDLRRVRRPGISRTAIAAGLLSVGFGVVLIGRNLVWLSEDGRIYGRELPELITAAGGQAAVRACGPVGASHFERQAVAYRLHLRQMDIRTGIDTAVRTVVAREGTGAARVERLPVRLRVGSWVLRSSCPRWVSPSGGRRGPRSRGP